MLVLSRKVGQRIRIGKDVTITVVRITGGGVRLGIDAPVELPVIREELLAELEGADIVGAAGPDSPLRVESPVGDRSVGDGSVGNGPVIKAANPTESRDV